MDNIIIHFEDIDHFKLDVDEITTWLNHVAKSENYVLQEVNIIFCSDNYLLHVNKEFLAHDYYTDIITFDNSENKGTIISDIFISVERVRENAQQFKITFQEELHRVMVHGLLHLVGYNDKNDVEKRMMKEKENSYLSLL